MKAAAFSLVVLTLNAAGPRRVHKGWETRRDSIAARLKAAPPDAAAYQEVWHPEDLDAFAHAAGHGHSAADAALGLGVTSRLPIESSASVDLDDGAGAMRASLAAGRARVDVYSARLDPHEGAFGPRRLGQLFRLAEFVRAQSSTHSYVLLGDLGVSSDEREPALLLDLLEARDLCVSHGDEVCGRTRGEQRVDYALIPYSSREPGAYARTAFTDLFTDDEEAGPPHFGLTVKLDSRFPSLRPAASPQGRDEALAVILDAVAAARADADLRLSDAGWLPFLGAWRSAAVQDEIASLISLEEEIRSARLRAVRPASPATPE